MPAGPEAAVRCLPGLFGVHLLGLPPLQLLLVVLMPVPPPMLLVLTMSLPVLATARMGTVQGSGRGHVCRGRTSTSIKCIPKAARVHVQGGGDRQRAAGLQAFKRGHQGLERCYVLQMQTHGQQRAALMMMHAQSPHPVSVTGDRPCNLACT